jgi:hypothetical protein
VELDDAGSLTLGDGEEICDVGLSFVVACWKMSVSCFSATSWPLPIVAKGAAGAGFRSALVSSLAAMVALSVEDKRGMQMSAGKHSTLSIMRSLPVLEQ